MMAARYGSEDAVQLLLKRGADARLRNDLGLSAADFARQAGREALTESLLRAAR
jgi:ankyrin repeat protein